MGSKTKEEKEQAKEIRLVNPDEGSEWNYNWKPNVLPTVSSFFAGGDILDSKGCRFLEKEFKKENKKEYK